MWEKSLLYLSGEKFNHSVSFFAHHIQAWSSLFQPKYIIFLISTFYYGDVTLFTCTMYEHLLVESFYLILSLACIPFFK